MQVGLFVVIVAAEMSQCWDAESLNNPDYTDIFLSLTPKEKHCHDFNVCFHISNVSYSAVYSVK